MKSNYWSLSPFADHIRAAFGVPKMPYAMPMEGWKEYNKSCQITRKMRIGNWLSNDFLDILQDIVEYIPNKIHSAIYFISNVVNSTHTLRTNTNIGQWADLSNRIPDALFNGLIDFVEKECFWMWVMCCADTDCEDSSVRAYGQQSYLKRKLYPIKIKPEVRTKYGIRWLEFQNSHLEDKSMYNDLIAAYWFAKNRYSQFDAFIESGYHEFQLAYGDKAKIPDSLWERIRELEAEFEEQCTQHLNTIVKYRGALWT